MKRFLAVILLTGCTATANSVVTSKEISVVSNNTPKNIIMIIGDGMGPAYTTAYRYFVDDPDTPSIEKTVFDRHFVGMASTFPARESGYVTDSAAGATALATGVKSYNGAISVDSDKRPLTSVLTFAKAKNKKIGVVVTSQVNHATPATYLTHNEDRNNYNQIADSYVDDGWKTDVLLGGGLKYFHREDRNLIEEFKKDNGHFINHYQQLSDLPDNKPVLGLFANIGLPWAIDDKQANRLKTMTKAAISALSNTEGGFFLLIEASQIDWGGHKNDIATAMAEMHDLAKTLEYLEVFVAENPDTLVVLTADHSTGGLSLGANGKYEWEPKVLRQMTMSPQAIAQKITEQKLNQQTLNTMLNFELTDEEYALLYEIEAADLVNAITINIRQIIDGRTNTGWSTSAHNAVDVQVFALGNSKNIFSGSQDNTDIAKKLFKLLK
ncbi:alkaline phosphatase [Paraglaciecola arctica]|nr:alkaline phosphatase [Paraglaciecola arctica]